MHSIAFLTARGRDPDELANSSTINKLFYIASIDLFYEEEAQKYQALFGSR